MAYEKTTWLTGDVLTATKMNNMEAGIEAASTYDTTLTVEGQAADAKAVGDELKKISTYDTTITVEGQAADAKAVGNRICAMDYCDTSIVEYVRPYYNSKERNSGAFLASAECTDTPIPGKPWFVKWFVVSGGSTILIEATPYYELGDTYQKQYSYGDAKDVFGWAAQHEDYTLSYPTDLFSFSQCLCSRSGNVVHVYVSLKTATSLSQGQTFTLTGHPTPVPWNQALRIIDYNAASTYINITDTNIQMSVDRVFSADNWIRFAFSYICS